MRLAFINQPFGDFAIPLKSDSVGLWSFHVAARCADRFDVTFYTPDGSWEIVVRRVAGSNPFPLGKRQTNAMQSSWRTCCGNAG